MKVVTQSALGINGRAVRSVSRSAVGCRCEHLSRARVDWVSVVDGSGLFQMDPVRIAHGEFSRFVEKHYMHA